jgi:hypothetical protein
MTSGDSRTRLAALLVFAGILIEIATLSRGDPLAFLAFLLAAVPLQVAGGLILLASWLFATRPGD